MNRESPGVGGDVRQSRNSRHKWTRGWIRRLLLLIGAALFVYLILQLGTGAILEMLRRTGWGFVSLVGLYTVYNVLRAWALKASVSYGSLSLRDAIWTRMSAEAFELVSLVGPFLTIPAKGWLAAGRGVTRREAYAASIAEYLVYAFISAALSIVALLLLQTRAATAGVAKIAGVMAVGMALFLVISAVAIWRRFYLIGSIIAAAGRLSRGRFVPDMIEVHRMEDLLLLILRDRPAQFASIAAIDLVAHLLLTLELLIIMRLLDLPSSVVNAFVIDAGTKFAGVAFAMVPAQIGVSEGTYAVAFAALSLPAAAGFAVALLRRVRTLLLCAVGLGMLYGRRSVPKEEIRGDRRS